MLLYPRHHLQQWRLQREADCKYSSSDAHIQRIRYLKKYSGRGIILYIKNTCTYNEKQIVSTLPVRPIYKSSDIIRNTQGEALYTKKQISLITIFVYLYLQWGLCRSRNKYLICTLRDAYLNEEKSTRSNFLWHLWLKQKLHSQKWLVNTGKLLYLEHRYVKYHASLEVRWWSRLF